MNNSKQVPSLLFLSVKAATQDETIEEGWIKRRMSLMEILRQPNLPAEMKRELLAMEYCNGCRKFIIRDTILDGLSLENTRGKRKCHYWFCKDCSTSASCYEEIKHIIRKNMGLDPPDDYDDEE